MVNLKKKLCLRGVQGCLHPLIARQCILLCPKTRHNVCPRVNTVGQWIYNTWILSQILAYSNKMFIPAGLPPFTSHPPLLLADRFYQ